MKHDWQLWKVAELGRCGKVDGRKVLSVTCRTALDFDQGGLSRSMHKAKLLDPPEVESIALYIRQIEACLRWSEMYDIQSHQTPQAESQKEVVAMMVDG